MFYTIDTYSLAQKLALMLRQFRQEYGEIAESRLKANLTPRDLHESAVRMCWNTFNTTSKFPWEAWDDNAAIARWFHDYTIDVVAVDFGGEAVYDEPSMELYREVIDPFCIETKSYLQRLRVRKNWAWEEHRVVDIRHDCLLMETIGDWRVKDWERIQREQKAENILSEH